MKLRELIEALQKAPPEAMDQYVLMCCDERQSLQMLNVVEAVKIKELDGTLAPWQVVLVRFDRLMPELYPEDERRIYLSDVSSFERKAKKKKSRPRKQPA